MVSDFLLVHHRGVEGDEGDEGVEGDEGGVSGVGRWGRNLSPHTPHTSCLPNAQCPMPPCPMTND
ncbi:hypothetical protein H6G93_09960 [Nostoc sp. FACHB-973]|nr:hypothetical protein [Nostoc sp. FACHB-973]